MARLNVDTPPIQGNELPDDLNHWFSTLTDQVNSMFEAMIANVTDDIGGGGAGPITVSVPQMTATSIVVATIASSTNPVSVVKAIPYTTPTDAGFNITFSANPGASCIVNYVVFTTPWPGQGGL